MVKGLRALNKEAAKIILLTQMVANSQSDLSCFAGGGKDVAISEMKERLCATERLSKARAAEIITDLIY